MPRHTSEFQKKPLSGKVKIVSQLFAPCFSQKETNLVTCKLIYLWREKSRWPMKRKKDNTSTSLFQNVSLLQSSPKLSPPTSWQSTPFWLKDSFEQQHAFNEATNRRFESMVRWHSQRLQTTARFCVSTATQLARSYIKDISEDWRNIEEKNLLQEKKELRAVTPNILQSIKSSQQIS